MCCSSGPSPSQINLQNAQTQQTQAVTSLYDLEAGAFPQLLQQNQQQFNLDQSWMQTEEGLAQQSLGIQQGYAASQEALANQEIAQSNQQMQIAGQMFQNYQTQFSEQQSIVSGLTKVFAPIFQKGPNQYGFSQAEDTALRTQATEGVAQNYLSAQQAAGNILGASGGGKVGMWGAPPELLPSGAAAAVQAGIAGGAAQQQSQEQLGITQAGYQQGYNEWLAAAQGLGSAAQLDSPNASGQLAMQGFQTSNSGLAGAGNSLAGASGSSGAGLGGILSTGQSIAGLNSSYSGAISALGGYGQSAANLGNAATNAAESAYGMASHNQQLANSSSMWNVLGGILGGPVGGILGNII